MSNDWNTYSLNLLLFLFYFFCPSWKPMFHHCCQHFSQSILFILATKFTIVVWINVFIVTLSNVVSIHTDRLVIFLFLFIFILSLDLLALPFYSCPMYNFAVFVCVCVCVQPKMYWICLCSSYNQRQQQKQLPFMYR